MFVGIGAALPLQRFRPALGGLGLGGAMSINSIFGVVLVAWLLLSETSLPLRGMLVLSTLAVILVGIGLAEAVWLLRKESA